MKGLNHSSSYAVIAGAMIGSVFLISCGGGGGSAKPIPTTTQVVSTLTSATTPQAAQAALGGMLQKTNFDQKRTGRYGQYKLIPAIVSLFDISIAYQNNNPTAAVTIGNLYKYLQTSIFVGANASVQDMISTLQSQVNEAWNNQDNQDLSLLVVIFSPNGTAATPPTITLDTPLGPFSEAMFMAWLDTQYPTMTAPAFGGKQSVAPRHPPTSNSDCITTCVQQFSCCMSGFLGNFPIELATVSPALTQDQINAIALPNLDDPGFEAQCSAAGLTDDQSSQALVLHDDFKQNVSTQITLTFTNEGACDSQGGG